MRIIVEKHFRKLLGAVLMFSIIAGSIFFFPVKKVYATVYSNAYYYVKACEYPDTVSTVGNSVYFAQQLLENFGYYNGGVDGDFGSNTRSAVYSYQSANGLSVDGQVGFYTWGQLLVDGELSTSFSCRNIGRSYYLCLNDTLNSTKRCVLYKVDDPLAEYTAIFF